MSVIAVPDIRLQVQPVDGARALAELRAEWEALERDAVFCGWQWLESWWRHYRQPGSELFTLALRDDDGRLAGLAPWYLSQSPGDGRVLRFLGGGEVCSDYLTVLARPPLQAVVGRALADWLAGEAADRWDLVDLAGVDGECRVMDHFSDRLRERGHIVHQQADASCWRANLAPDWEQYLASLSSSRRQRTRMLCRRNFDTGRAQLHMVRTQPELERAFELLIELHQKRRESLAQTGCFASERFTEFHREVAPRMLESGHLRMLWLELEGRPVAVEYGLVGGDTVYYYQGGFDPEFASERPGWLAFAGSLKLAIEEGYRWFDFLRGDESYKTSWRAEPQPLRQIRVVARRPSARVRHAAWRTGLTVKRWAKQGLTLAAGLKAEAVRAVSAARQIKPEGGG